MTYQPFAIANRESGLVKSKKDYVIPDDAFSELENMYVWRDRLLRRKGFELLGRLRRDLTAEALGDFTAAGAGDTVFNIFTGLGVAVLEPNAEMVPGTAALPLVLTIAAPGNNTLTDSTGTGVFVVSGAGVVITAATINYATGDVTITTSGAVGASAVTANLSYYPKLPVMGLRTWELGVINAEATIAFDTIYAYRFDNTNERFQEWIPGTTWTSVTSEQFFWTENFWNVGTNGIFWVCNNNTSNPIRFADGTTFTTFAPNLDNTGAPQQLRQALMLIAYRGRLVALNTHEGIAGGPFIQFPQRARWSQNGDPTDQTNAWNDNVAGRGGFIDCPTNERIVSAAFIRDTLTVRFERSTWLLRYTGNEILPFIWERINVELGAESTFSDVRFDKGVLSIGDKGITSCNGNSVERIDEAIPDEVFGFENDNNGPKRVHGIRDHFNRLVYWTFPASTGQKEFPDRLLVFNYFNNTWAVFTDSFTTLGQWQRFNDVTWNDLAGREWQTIIQAWNSSQFQARFPDIIGGNQQGWVHVLNKQSNNDPSLCVQDITAGTPAVISSPDHNLNTGEFIKITGILEATTGNYDVLNDRVYQIENLTTDTFALKEKPRFDVTAVTVATQAVVTAPGNDFNLNEIIQLSGVPGMVEVNGLYGKVVVEGDIFTVDINTTGFTAATPGGSAQNLSGLIQDATVSAGASFYRGLGQIARVMNFKARTKRYSYMQTGTNFQFGWIDFLANVTSQGEVACKIYANHTNTEAVNEENLVDNFFNSVFLTTREGDSNQTLSEQWHRFYCNTDASFIQFLLTLNERQLATEQIANSEVEIGATIMWSAPGGKIVP